ncbi:MFS transporter [Hyphococcus sp.]|uniref:MFS transporter n=1 Tax=Hyphococcus sp. TaxID=2038636 RepID=UPI0035C7283E
MQAEITPSVAGAATKAKLLASALAAAWFLSYCDRVNLSVAAIAMQAEFGWTETTKGWVMGSVFVGYIASQLAGGALVLRFGAVSVVSLGVIGFSVATLATPAAASHSLTLLITVRIILGAFEGVVIPATYSLVGSWAGANERARLIAIVASGATLGAPGGLMASGFLAASVGWQAVFYVFGGLGFVWSLLWIVVAGKDMQRKPSTSGQESSRPKRAAGARASLQRFLTHPALWAAAAAKFGLNWIVYVFIAWLPSYYSAMQGAAITTSAVLSALPWISMTLMLHMSALRADRMLVSGIDPTLVRKIMQSIGIGGGVVFLLLAPFATSPLLAVTFTCAATGFLAFCFSGADAAMLDMAVRYRGLVGGFANALGNFPGIIAIPLIGWSIDATGSYSAGFVCSAVVGLASLGMWLRYGTAKQIFE